MTGGTPYFIHAPCLTAPEALDFFLADSSVQASVDLWNRIDVAVVEPLGAHTLVTAFAGEPRQVFRAALDSAQTYHAGQRLRLRPDTTRVRWYDSAGQMIDHTHGD